MTDEQITKYAFAFFPHLLRPYHENLVRDLLRIRGR